MTDGIRKRRENGRRYDAALESWHTSSAPKPCRACHDAGIILHEDGSLPCPYCRPDEAARAATP